MRTILKDIGCCVIILLCIVACTHKKAALDREKFTALLIDMHMADGALSLSQGYSTNHEKRNYAYYNSVFDKYGIDRAEFDSCMRYYSAQAALFDEIYDIVIDSLNRRLTEQNRRLAELRAGDSINYFPQPDTLLLDTLNPVWVTEIDSIVPGNYKFSTTVKFDTLEKKRSNRIVAFFLSPDNKDTLHVREIRMSSDTVRRHYEWSQYVDSAYNRLIIKIADTDRPEKLKYKRGRIWGTTLYRPYTSPKTIERLKKSLSPGKAEAAIVPADDILLRPERSKVPVRSPVKR